MADQYVQVAPNSTGLKIDTSELTVNAQTVERQRINLADPTTALAIAAVKAALPDNSEYGIVTRQTGLNFPAGFMRTSDEPRQVFYDPFDGSVVDVTNRWTSTNSSGVAAAQATGNLTLGSGTGTGWSYLTSQPTFVPTVPSWMVCSAAIQLEATTIGNNASRFWGMGTTPGSPTTAIPITDGVGFEVEFVTLDGETVSVVSLDRSQVRAIGRREIPHVRTMAA